MGDARLFNEFDYQLSMVRTARSCLLLRTFCLLGDAQVNKELDTLIADVYRQAHKESITFLLALDELWCILLAGTHSFAMVRTSMICPLLRSFCLLGDARLFN